MTHTTTHNFIITIKFQGTSVFGLSLTPDLSKAVDLKIELLGVHTNRESHLQRLSLPIKMGMELSVIMTNTQTTFAKYSNSQVKYY